MVPPVRPDERCNRAQLLSALAYAQARHCLACGAAIALHQEGVVACFNGLESELFNSTN